jgi:diguanylate cyclase (GGDEF)-like protein/PAS domain S-box-containing protein
MSNASEIEIRHLKTEVKRLESKIAKSQAAFLNIVGKSLDGIMILDSDRMVVYANYAAMNLFGKNIADLLGEPLDIAVQPLQLRLQAHHVEEVSIPRADKEACVTEVFILNIDWNNSPGYVVSFRDITERKRTEKMLEYMAAHDVMTSLPNRVNFDRKLSEAIQDAKTYDMHMALLYIDIDDFKIINDTFGHQVGDELLKSVSAVLKKVVRAGDMVARLGGDEFALILTNLRKPEYAEVVAQKIIKQLDVTFAMAGNQEVYTNVSVGIAVYPTHGASGLTLIKHADIAMYSAKHNGKNQYHVYNEVLHETKDRALLISSGLRSALQKEEFFVVYQPIIELNTGVCSGVEALLRWEHPTLGLLYPTEFIPEIEKARLMPAIGKWVMQRVFSDFKQLNIDPRVNASKYIQSI